MGNARGRCNCRKLRGKEIFTPGGKSRVCPWRKLQAPFAAHPECSAARCRSGVTGSRAAVRERGRPGRWAICKPMAAAIDCI